jgi:pyruvate/2-oxoacid:ferredoxin oxidoreductase beta subunit
MKTVINNYIREEMFPNIWCPGCGNGIVLSAIIRAIDDLNWDKNEIVAVSGIGCSSRITGYVDFCTMNTTHGRALPFATGIKMANPDLKVIVVMGDGDCSAIGGNHFIHAARRNIDLTAIIINNMIYGMTGGQYSPLTPTDIEIISDCPVSYGKMNKMKSPVDMLKWIKDIAVSKKVWEGLSPDEKKGKYAIGEFLSKDRPGYTELYEEIIKKAQKMGGNK